MLWAASRMDSPAPGRTILGPAKLPKALRSHPRTSSGREDPADKKRAINHPPGCLDTNPARCPLHSPRQPPSAVKLVTSWGFALVPRRCRHRRSFGFYLVPPVPALLSAQLPEPSDPQGTHLLGFLLREVQTFDHSLDSELLKNGTYHGTTEFGTLI